MVRLSPQEVDAMISSLRLVQFAAGFTFVCGVLYAIWKRLWLVLAMVLFLFMYLMVHAVHAFTFHRFLTAVHWIALLVSCIGIRELWRLLDKNGRIPRPVLAVIQLALLIALVIWTGGLFGFLKPMNHVSARSVPVLYVALAAAAAVAVTWVIVRRGKPAWSTAVMLAAVAAILFSNQLSVALVVKNGKEDDEFRKLDEWYAQYAGPGDKLVCSMFMVLQMIDEKNAPYFLPLPATGKGPGTCVSSLRPATSGMSRM